MVIVKNEDGTYSLVVDRNELLIIGGALGDMSNGELLANVDAEQTGLADALDAVDSQVMYDQLELELDWYAKYRAREVSRCE